MNRSIFTLTLILFTVAISSQAQTQRDYIRRGNRLMQDTLRGSDHSDKAIVQYQKAIDKDSTFAIARYNLGNALIRQNKAQDAMKEYMAAAKYETDKLRLSDIYHNMGVLCQASEKYAEAVECYKESLRNNPSNDETRYNYVLAKWHLKNQQEKGGGEDKQQEEKKEDNQGKDKKQQQQDKNNGKKKEQQQQQKQSQSDLNENMSKENAERLLNAAMRSEKETQEKIQRQQQESPRRHLQKQW